MISGRAILLRRSRLTETSLVLHWLTEESGRVKSVAKGALKPNGPMFGKLDLFFLNDIAIVRSKRSDLHMLREVAVLETHEALRRDLNGLSLVAYFVELIEANTEMEFPIPDVFDLFRRALRHLSEQPATCRALLHFERELARLLGLLGEGEPYQHLLAGMRSLPKTRASMLEKLGSS